MAADLHLHSIYSDGSFSPKELIEMAVNKGVKAIALADHDTVEGVEEMVEYGLEKGIEVIPAIEFSTFSKQAEIHILGYYIDYKEEVFLAKIKELFNSRLNRAREMVKKLNNLGIGISYKDVQGLAGDKYIGRPHIARAMIAAGYIDTMKQAFSTDYIGNGGRAYVSKSRLSPADAIKIIKQAGGIAVLAHPFFINNGNSLDKDTIKSFISLGLEGIEVYHSQHDKQTSDYYLDIAKDLGLLVTGGSDFHGANTPGLEIGDVILAEKYVAELRRYYQDKPSHHLN